MEAHGDRSSERQCRRLHQLAAEPLRNAAAATTAASAERRGGGGSAPPAVDPVPPPPPAPAGPGAPSGLAASVSDRRSCCRGRLRCRAAGRPPTSWKRALRPAPATSSSIRRAAPPLSHGLPAWEWQLLVRVTAANAQGTSAPSNEIAFTVDGSASPAPGGPPAPPLGLVASASGSTVTLAWRPPALGGAPSYYVVEAGSGPGLRTSRTSQPATQRLRSRPAASELARISCACAPGTRSV